MTARERTRQPPPTVFVIWLEAAPGVDSIKELRALLKILLRQFGLRATAVREEQPDYSTAQHERPLIMKPSTKSTTLPTPARAEPLTQLDADIATLAAEARELTEDTRVGDDLRFKKGKWKKTIGDVETEIGDTTTFAADMRSYRRGWIKWVDRKPVLKIIARPIDGFVSPQRDQLPDRDESQWPRDAKGVAQDSWQENFLIVMRDLSDGRLCTWTTTSWYGQKAIGALLNLYVRDQKKHPDQMPVVLLSSETKTTMNYGDVEAPVLNVVDWQPFGEGAAPPGMRNLPLPKLPVTQELLPPPKSLGAAMDDEIPFAPEWRG